jgi:hypothetical protein
MTRAEELFKKRAGFLNAFGRGRPLQLKKAIKVMLG